MKAPVPKVVEAFVDHPVDLPSQDIVHLLQQVMTGSVPLLGGRLDKSLCDDVQGVVWKFP